MTQDCLDNWLVGLSYSAIVTRINELESMIATLTSLQIKELRRLKDSICMTKESKDA